MPSCTRMKSSSSPPAETGPRFLVWGGLLPQAPEEFKERFDFLLYKRIRQRRGGDDPVYSLEATLIYKDEQGNACTDTTKHGRPYPPLRQLMGSPKVKLASWVVFEPDHRDRDHHPCSATLCKPLNDLEYCTLLEQLEEADAFDAERSVAYYRQVKTIFGEWYHEHRLPLPKCEDEKSDLLTKSQVLTSSPALLEYAGWLYATHTLPETWTIIQQDARSEKVTLSIRTIESLKSSMRRFHNGKKKDDFKKKYRDVHTFEGFLETNRCLLQDVHYSPEK